MWSGADQGEIGCGVVLFGHRTPLGQRSKRTGIAVAPRSYMPMKRGGSASGSSRRFGSRSSSALMRDGHLGAGDVHAEADVRALPEPERRLHAAG